MPAMRLDRDLADAELVGYLLVEQATDDQRHDLPLAPAERCVAVSQQAYLRIAGERRPAAVERLPDRADQHVLIDRFRQELDGAALHRLDDHRGITMSGDEDERHVVAIDGDELLQLETVEVGKIDVEDQA